MSDIDRFRPDDRRGVDTLYRRTYGADAAEAIRLRWDWQHRRNPYNPTGQPGIWVAREGPTVVGQCPTLPVRLSLKGIEIDGAWGAGAMIAPERDRQGLDEALIRTKVSLVPESVAEIRVVDIIGLDRQADGGTHVRTTGEVGAVRVVKTESKGKGNKRVRIEVTD